MASLPRGCSCVGAEYRTTDTGLRQHEMSPDIHGITGLAGSGRVVPGASESQSTPAPSRPPLPRAVTDACAAFAGGDPEEAASNRAVAQRMWAEQKSPEQIVTAIRQGAGDGTWV